MSQERQYESEIQANSSQATRLYQRGVAAARAGQKRVAAGFLTRSVKLDPRNEGAWLWLSGVLDDPHQVAFCLNSVLKLNPGNTRAQRGLRWLEERELLQGKPPATPLMDIRVDEPVSERQAREHGEAWWVSWRQLQRDVRRVTLWWWSIPVIVVALALIIHQSFAVAVEQSKQRAMLPTTAVVAPVAQIGPADPSEVAPEVEAPVVPILESAPTSIREGQTIKYMNKIMPLRQSLRDAVDQYRATTGTPGGSLTHVAEAQAFQSSVQDAYEKMQSMAPPEDLEHAHNEYLKGLEVELAAIDDLLEFYGSYRVELANRAAFRFQEANSHFENARQLFDARLKQIEYASTISVHTVR